jgi:hypothetical protein
MALALLLATMVLLGSFIYNDLEKRWPEQSYKYRNPQPWGYVLETEPGDYELVVTVICRVEL